MMMMMMMMINVWSLLLWLLCSGITHHGEMKSNLSLSFEGNKKVKLLIAVFRCQTTKKLDGHVVTKSKEDHEMFFYMWIILKLIMTTAREVEYVYVAVPYAREHGTD